MQLQIGILWHPIWFYMKSLLEVTFGFINGAWTLGLKVVRLWQFDGNFWSWRCIIYYSVGICGNQGQISFELEIWSMCSLVWTLFLAYNTICSNVSSLVTRPWVIEVCDWWEAFEIIYALKNIWNFGLQILFPALARVKEYLLCISSVI